MPEDDEQWMRAQGFRPPTDLRPEIPHPARIYDWFLGGKDNFASDRAVGESLVAMGEDARTAARANRAMLQRAVRALAGEGFTQFLDIGAGIPSSGNTHEIAQRANPRARVVYVDNDPIVLAHARALMSGVPGTTKVLQADLRDPKAILSAPETTELIDFGKPVVLLLVAVLHFIADSDDPYGIVSTLLDALPSGSRLVLTHGTNDALTEAEHAKVDEAYHGLVLRTGKQVGRFFDGLDLLDPGLVLAPFWRPDAEPAAGSERLGIYAGVAAKP